MLNPYLVIFYLRTNILEPKPEPNDYVDDTGSTNFGDVSSVLSLKPGVNYNQEDKSLAGPEFVVKNRMTMSQYQIIANARGKFNIQLFFYLDSKNLRYNMEDDLILENSKQSETLEESPAKKSIDKKSDLEFSTTLIKNQK